MAGAGVATVPFAEQPLRCERHTVETEAKNVGAAALLLRIDPGPGGMDDAEVAAKRADPGAMSGDLPG